MLGKRMTELPQLHRARTIDSEQAATTRQWKRVKRLENDLGFSNLVLELIPEARMPEGRHLMYCVDEKGSSRKRRLSAVRTLGRIQGSATQLHDFMEGAGSCIFPSTEDKHLPWTQPIGQQHSSFRGKLSSLSLSEDKPIVDTQPGEVPARGAKNTQLFNKRSAFELYRDAAPDVYTRSTCGPDVQPASGQRITCQAVGNELPPSRGEKDKGVDDVGETNGSADRVTAPINPLLDASSRQYRRKTEPKGVPTTAAAELYRDTCKIPQKTPAELYSESGVRDVGRDYENSAETLGRESHENTKPRIIFVRTSSRPKLHKMRSGSSRSLLSPKNPLNSSTVVTRVRENLKQGGERHSNVLLVGSGTFNPIHKLHIRRFYLARDFLEADLGMTVVGGILSPSHPTLVRQRHRVRAAEIIPPKHRLSMARAAVGKGSWLIVDPWEVTRKRIMDYMSVLEHAKEVCHETFPGHAGDITILYMCQASQIHHLNPALLRGGGYGVITVCRPLEKARLLKELSPSFRNIANVVEDSEILSAELEKTSSAMVRHLLKQGKSVEGMVGRAVARYIEDNSIAHRISGRQKWTIEDKAFMFEREDKEDRPYHNLPRMHVRRASQMPLHY